MIVNVVLSASLDTEINLGKLVNARIFNIQYNPKKFCAAVVRFENPRATCLLFQNGKTICAGTRNRADATVTLQKLMQGLGCSELNNLKVVNVVAASSMNRWINLPKFSKTHSRVVIFEKEFFPGATFKLESGVTIVAFESGKYYCTGAPTEQLALESIDIAREILQPYCFAA